MVEEEARLEWTIAQRREQLGEHLEQLQSRMDEARHRSKRVVWGVAAACAALVALIAYRSLRRASSAPRAALPPTRA